MPTTTQYWAISAILAFLFSIFSVPLVPRNFAESLTSQNPLRVLLLTAHPDDECMFFAPTLLGLNALGGDVPRTNFELYSLCLSSGDSDGLGDVRKGELGRSLDVLGIPEERRWIKETPYVCSGYLL